MYIYIYTYYFTLRCIALHGIASHGIALHYLTFHCITLHYIPLHDITVHYNTLYIFAEGSLKSNFRQYEQMKSRDGKSQGREEKKKEDQKEKG